MSISPAPVQTVRQPADGASATAGEAGGAQPPAVQQAQQAQQGGSGMPYGMPMDLYNAVLLSNLRQLGTMQLLSVSLLALHQMCPTARMHPPSHPSLSSPQSSIACQPPTA